MIVLRLFCIFPQYNFLDMRKVKLIKARKHKGFSQSQLAEQLCMDVSNYNRREKGQTKISFSEWEKLSKILEVPVEDIYENEESNFITAKDKSVSTSNEILPYTAFERLLDNQQKSIAKLEEEVFYLKGLLQKK